MRFDQKLQRLILISGLALGLSACQVGGDPLAGDKVFESLCPESGCADATPDQQQLMLRGPSATTIQHKVASGDGVEFGGECYASTYPNNFIRVSLFHQNNNPIALTIGTDLFSVTQADVTPRCVQGRFHFAISGAKMPAGVSYRVEAQLVGLDDQSVQFTNTSTGKFSVRVNRQ